MNKQAFLEELQKQTGYSIEKCILINNVIEDNFLIGKKNKERITIGLINNGFTSKEADNIYDITSKIITKAVSEKIKHPFKNLD